MVKIATWNTDNPKTSNQILEDIADIEENLQELHDVIAAITNGTLGTTEPANFKVDVVAADTISEASGGSGVTVDGLLLKDGNVYLGIGNFVYLDDDNDSWLYASADDTIHLGVANANQVQITDGLLRPTVDNDIDIGVTATHEVKDIHTRRILARTGLVADTIAEFTGATGVTIDGCLIKDGKIAQANSIDSDAYVDGSIDLAHMSAESIDSDQYVDGSIDAAHLAAGAVAIQIFSLQTVFAEADGSDEAEYVWQGTDPYVVCRTWYYHTGTPATCYIKANITDSGNGATNARVVFGGVTVNTATVDNANGDVDGSGDISGVAAGWVEVTVSGVKSASSDDSTLLELGVTIA